MSGYVQEFTKGFWKDNPVFKMVLGLCPLLAVTSTAVNGIAMGVASTFARELERLREDGLEIEVTKREYIIKQTLDSVRNTQLFRTLLHEIGHNNDPKPVERASQEKEDYAHKFAEKMRSKLILEGSIPFPRIFNKESILDCGMKTEWFLNNQ